MNRRLPIGSFLGVFTALLAAPLFAQGPITDKLTVTFANPVMVGSTRLAAGEYTVRRIQSASNPHILEFSSANGTQVEATITAIPALDNRNNRSTQVLLEHQGGTQHVKEIWLEGGSYGYELKPTSMSMMGMQDGPTQSRVRLTGTYTPSQVVAENRDSRATASQERPEASSQNQASRDLQGERTRSQQSEQQTRTESPQSQQTRTEAPREQPAIAQATPPVQPAPTDPQTTPQQNPQTGTPQQQTDRTDTTRTRDTTQDRTGAQDATQTERDATAATLPATAANWLGLVIAGASLTAVGAGLMFARRD